MHEDRFLLADKFNKRFIKKSKRIIKKNSDNSFINNEVCGCALPDGGI
jgi:hypothetical protein